MEREGVADRKAQAEVEVREVVLQGLLECALVVGAVDVVKALDRFIEGLWESEVGGRSAASMVALWLGGDGASRAAAFSAEVSVFPLIRVVLLWIDCGGKDYLLDRRVEVGERLEIDQGGFVVALVRLQTKPLRTNAGTKEYETETDDRKAQGEPPGGLTPE